jgi:hypothetical protein
MMIAVSPNTVKNKLLSCVLKPLMCESIKLWISAGGLLVAVVFGGDCARDTGAVNASAVVAIAVRRVGFDMALGPVFRDGLSNINAPDRKVKPATLIFKTGH